jgi:hypothetical protein
MSWWSTSRLGRCTPGERALGTHCIAGWVGPRAGLDSAENRTFSFSCRIWNPDLPARNPLLHWLAIPDTYCRPVFLKVFRWCNSQYSVRCVKTRTKSWTKFWNETDFRGIRQVVTILLRLSDSRRWLGLPLMRLPACLSACPPARLPACPPAFLPFFL